MQWLCWWRPPCVLRTVIVTLTHDDTTGIRGVLWSARGPWLTIRKPELLKPHIGPETLDGEVVLHRAQVAFIQVLL